MTGENPQHRTAILEKDHLLSNEIYDILKNTAQIYLPATGTLYATVAAIWGLPAAQEVLATIVAIDTALGAFLGFSTKSYNNSEAKFDGNIDVIETDAKKTFSLNLNTDPNELDSKDQVLFKVNSLPGNDG